MIAPWIIRRLLSGALALYAGDLTQGGQLSVSRMSLNLNRDGGLEYVIDRVYTGNSSRRRD